MDNYLTQKIKPVDILKERLQKEQDYKNKLRKLDASSAEVVPDFQSAEVKDLPVDKINTKAPQSLTGIEAFRARQAVNSAAGEAKLAALGKIGDTINYSKFKDLGKTLGKKAMGVLPFAGAGYAALNGDSAMAAEELAGDVPVVGQAFEAIKPTASGPASGSLDDRLERGQLTDEDKLLIKQEALQRMSR